MILFQILGTLLGLWLGLLVASLVLGPLIRAYRQRMFGLRSPEIVVQRKRKQKDDLFFDIDEPGEISGHVIGLGSDGEMIIDDDIDSEQLRGA